MLRKPKYCAECSEKIERIEWNLLTNRRYCEGCTTIYAPVSNVWKFIIVLVLTFCGGGVFFNQFLQTKKSPIIVATTQNTQQNSTQQNIESPKVVAPNTQTTTQNQPQPKQGFVSQNAPPNQTTTPPPTKPTAQNNQPPQVAAIPAEPAESTYFCGAKTKKDAPCSRRVKGGGRCWQHVGQTAMLPESKLLIR